jgi:hypothetical protein
VLPADREERAVVRMGPHSGMERQHGVDGAMAVIPYQSFP